MNTAAISTDHGSGHPSLGSPPLNGLGYTLGLCFGILIAFLIITYASYTCKRVRAEANAIRNHYPQSDSDDVTFHDFAMITIQQLGLDEVTLSSFPQFTFSNLNADDSTTTTSSACSICLADYADDDLLRLLPDCGHFFHLKCVDPWLLLHPTCSVCRFSPLPSPAASAPTSGY